MLVDDNREEHRMIIFGNDSQPVQERLIVDNTCNESGILAQKVHEESYTVTLYALLKDYGLTPVFRIKPRIRFHRSNYDNLSSSAPLQYSLNDIIHFAELKRGTVLMEKVDDIKLAEILGDAPTIAGMTDDPALQLVSQRDVSLRNPPFKTKTKVFGKSEDEGVEEAGIPIGSFLDALNQPQRTEEIFKKFTRGSEFAHDLRKALENYEEYEFQFGLYSRYERRDCVLAGGDIETSGYYRATFDPWTALGYIRPSDDNQQFQILAHERGTRWEHKVMLELLDTDTLERLATEIPALRSEYLIGRVLSKSQTALTRLAQLRKSQLNLTPDLETGYTLQLEIHIPEKRFSVIDHRRKLRAAFNGNGNYRLHPLNGEFVEEHLNLAKGLRNGVVWTLDNVDLLTGPPPLNQKDEEFVIRKTLNQNRFVVRSAKELRERLPKNGFEKCWNESIDKGGYTVLNHTTGRVYAVSYGRQITGNIRQGEIRKEDMEHYLSIEYLGIDPSRAETSHFEVKTGFDSREAQQGFFDRLFRREVVPPFYSQLMRTESQAIDDMKTLARHCKAKLKIP
ncbi:hypothetical protein F4083_11935 [Candidatus Poribacteria bacterium]|nr:hypothetical protein [Candidatus Poribacteria bacterium]MYB63069.1 hypothetical protein [Candidatus Poribacteria bacterium]MYF56362.1 hypothetical protein [Candidatus Poribacteria bacterium]MYI95006.1 hypothetical protein [Candidatus Poribacteria bacterium]